MIIKYDEIMKKKKCTQDGDNNITSIENGLTLIGLTMCVFFFMSVTTLFG